MPSEQNVPDQESPRRRRILFILSWICGAAYIGAQFSIVPRGVATLLLAIALVGVVIIVWFSGRAGRLIAAGAIVLSAFAIAGHTGIIPAELADVCVTVALIATGLWCSVSAIARSSKRSDAGDGTKSG